MNSTPTPPKTPHATPPRLSKDAKWRSFPKVPHLLQYVGSGTYYARVKIGGKIIRESLKTNVFSTARLRLVDYLKENRELASDGAAPLFASAVELYRTTAQRDASLKPSSKGYREVCISRIKSSWPALWRLPLSEITPDACQEWAARLKQEAVGLRAVSVSNHRPVRPPRRPGRGHGLAVSTNVHWLRPVRVRELGLSASDPRVDGFKPNRIERIPRLTRPHSARRSRNSHRAVRSASRNCTRPRR